MIRIGQSSDIHQLVEKRNLILGGVKIEHHLGLLGHSDADALVHAISEALLGSLALGDLGKFFPDNDPKWKDVNSLLILKEVNKMINNQGYHIVNIDSLIMIEKPKMAPHINKMRENIAKTLEIETDQVSVKATRGEGLGFIGEEKGVLAQAIVLVSNE